MAVFVFGLVFMFQILDHQHYCYPISFGFLGNCEYCSKICFPSVSSISILPCDLVSYPATVLVMLSSKGLNKKNIEQNNCSGYDRFTLLSIWYPKWPPWISKILHLSAGLNSLDKLLFQITSHWLGIFQGFPWMRNEIQLKQSPYFITIGQFIHSFFAWGESYGDNYFHII